MIGETGYGKGGGFVAAQRPQGERVHDRLLQRQSLGVLDAPPAAARAGRPASASTSPRSATTSTRSTSRTLGHDTQHQRMVESAGWVTGARDGWTRERARLDEQRHCRTRTTSTATASSCSALPDLRASTLPRQLFGLPLRAGSRHALHELRAVRAAHDLSVVRWCGQPPVNGPVLRHRRGRPLHRRRARRRRQVPRPEQAPGVDPNLDDANNPASITQTEGDGVFQEGELLADSGQPARLLPEAVAARAVRDLRAARPKAACARRCTSPTSARTQTRTSSPRAAICARTSGATSRSARCRSQHIIEPRVRSPACSRRTRTTIRCSFPSRPRSSRG